MISESVSNRSRFDQDFEFLSNTIRSLLLRFPNSADLEKCQAWIDALCVSKTVFSAYQDKQKKYQNLCLYELMSCIKNKHLIPPFDTYPKPNIMESAINIFQNEMNSKEKLDNVNSEECELQHLTEDGTTFLATKALPNELGVMGYLAVSAESDFPLWFKSGDKNQMKSIKEIINRSNSNCKKKIIKPKRLNNWEQNTQLPKLYTKFINDIQFELDGKIAAKENKTINSLIEKIAMQVDSELQPNVWELLELDRQRLLGFFKRKFELRLVELTEQINGATINSSKETLVSFCDSQKCYLEDKTDKGVFEKIVIKEPAMKKYENEWNDLIFKPFSADHEKRLKKNCPSEFLEKFFTLITKEKRKTSLAVIELLEKRIKKMQNDIKTYEQEYKNRFEEVNSVVDKYEDLADNLRISKYQNCDDYDVASDFKRHNEELVEKYNAVKKKNQSLETRVQYFVEEFFELKRSLRTIKRNKKILREYVINSLLSDVKKLKTQVLFEVLSTQKEVVTLRS